METFVPCQLLHYSSAWAGSFLTGPSLTLSSREAIPPKPSQPHKGGWLCCYTVPSKRSSGARHKESFPFSAARKPRWCIPQSSLSESENARSLVLGFLGERCRAVCIGEVLVLLLLLSGIPVRYSEVCMLSGWRARCSIV